MTAGLKILFAASEVVPFAKTGGLADVAGALPQVLAGMGHDVRIVMPKYGCVKSEQFNLHPVTESFSIPHGSSNIDITIESSEAIPKVQTYFIRNDYLYQRETLYAQPDDDHRFVAYCRGIIEMLPHLGWIPDIIHCNDWHTGLVPVYLKTLYANYPAYRNIRTLYTIHNLAYQGIFNPELMELAGLPWELFTWDKLACCDLFNFMKAGLIYADKLSTVSETYAREIQTREYGAGLEGVLKYRQDDLYGIINGIDYQVWNSKTDSFIPHHFSADAINGKQACKRALQKEMRLPTRFDVPLFSIISRLTSQKGFDLLDKVFPQLFSSADMQVIILGTGEEEHQKMMKIVAAKFPDKLALALRFDNALAHRIYAGSDSFMMPSRYEPCGLGQMISLAYGTVPVVRATGGLADTVQENGKGNGFVFTDYTPVALEQAIRRALQCYAEHDRWQQVMRNGFASDFSWEASAKKYLKVYSDIS